MNRIGTGLAVVALLMASACGGGSGGDKKAASKPTQEDLGSVSSVVELRDALVAAGYECANWEQDDLVDLAAESGSCDDESVLSTFASQGDLQAQLDTFRGLDGMFKDADIEPEPILVGPNWIFTAPDADGYAAKLGGTISR